MADSKATGEAQGASGTVMVEVKLIPPGFTAEEIQRTYNSGEQITAVKMLRAETGCGLTDALSALRHGVVEQMPTFKELKARRRAERFGPRSLTLLKETETDLSDIMPRLPEGSLERSRLWLRIAEIRDLINDVEKTP